MNEELALCAKINFDNLERSFPAIKQHPFYRIAKSQLDEATGECDVEDSPYMDIIADINMPENEAALKSNKGETLVRIVDIG